MVRKGAICLSSSNVGVVALATILPSISGVSPTPSMTTRTTCLFIQSNPPYRTYKCVYDFAAKAQISRAVEHRTHFTVFRQLHKAIPSLEAGLDNRCIESEFFLNVCTQMAAALCQQPFDAFPMSFRTASSSFAFCCFRMSAKANLLLHFIILLSRTASPPCRKNCQNCRKSAVCMVLHTFRLPV